MGSLAQINGNGWPWNQSFSGGIFYAGQPDPEVVNIEDVAHSLAIQNRYIGHSQFPYSVGYHAILVYEAVRDRLLTEKDGKLTKEDYRVMLTALHHDSGEAFCGDILPQIKFQIPETRALVKKWDAAVAEAFGLIYPYPEIVDWADDAVLAAEKEQVMGPAPQQWKELPPPYPCRIGEKDWREIVTIFIQLHHTLDNYAKGQ